VDELALEIHTALSASLAAAQAGKWQEAEAARLDAYTSFDLTLEKKVLPRDPELAIRAERSFLDGGDTSLGIKTALDRKLRGADLEKAYQRTLADLAECQALLKVAVSPATISFTTATVVMREGLEAVVILAAILAGLRGTAEQRQRKGLIRGAWVAIAVTGLTFWLSRTLIKSLNHHGEKLEAVVSILAVFILLLVTNWVFHKVYWVQWNTKLRHLRKKVEGANGSRWESLGLIGVGFLTIYREGFETTLFLQSLILEGGIKAVSIGLGVGLLFIATIGFAVFKIGAKLPYRKMLVVTGVLVVSILVTFLGSSVRLFQTVGWMPIHPITWLHIPVWMGLWFGVYPSWEGMLIPPAGLVYVGGAWLYTKLAARMKTANAAVAAPQPRPAPVRPVTANA
jgi:high-affinity iron transporter